LAISEKFIKMEFVLKVLGKGEEKVSVITKNGIQVDLRFFNKDEFVDSFFK
jgi:DNA polymerase/3'-5' exonuclease PolX